MKVKLLIKQIGNQAFLDVKLKDILICIDNPDLYKWKILWIRGTGKANYSVIDIENNVNSSENGISYNIRDLIELSDSLTQLFEILVIGDRKLNKLIRYNDDFEMYDKCEFIIELIDSSFWEFTSSEDKSISNLQHKFKSAKKNIL